MDYLTLVSAKVSEKWVKRMNECSEVVHISLRPLRPSSYVCATFMSLHDPLGLAAMFH